MKNQCDTTERQRLGQRIREIRKAKGLTLIDVATRTGLSFSYITLVENARISVGIDTLAKIANALDCTVDLIEQQ
ncbi:MAG: helix-turn-helix domain-containing protein [Bacteroidales bacterium]